MFPSQDISVGRSLVTVFFCHHWFLSSLLRSYLVGGLEHEFYCSIMFHILGISSSQLTHIFQRGRSTTNQEPAINSYPPNIVGGRKVLGFCRMVSWMEAIQ